MTGERLELGISTCPNDTFTFHGLLTGAVDACGFDFAIELLDVQALNERVARGAFDAAKVSFAAALGLAEEVVVLPVGAAVGRGVGPVVLAPRRAAASDTSLTSRRAASKFVLAPGEQTTAALLWRLFHPGEGTLKHVVFSEIMPALARGAAWRGVCIHEGRFAYGAWDLELVEDLGATWEHATGLPLPLGGIVARRRLGPERWARLTQAIRNSLAYARADPQRALASMRLHAQEQADAVLWKHVELYVTHDTEDLSDEARRALVELVLRAVGAGAAPGGATLDVA